MRTGTIDLLTCDESSVLEDSEHVFFVVLHRGKRITDRPVYCKRALFPAAYWLAPTALSHVSVGIATGNRLVLDKALKARVTSAHSSNELVPKNDWRFQRHFVFVSTNPEACAPGFE